MRHSAGSMSEQAAGANSRLQVSEIRLCVCHRQKLFWQCVIRAAAALCRAAVCCASSVASASAESLSLCETHVGDCELSGAAPAPV